MQDWRFLRSGICRSFLFSALLAIIVRFSSSQPLSKCDTIKETLFLNTVSHFIDRPIKSIKSLDLFSGS